MSETRRDNSIHAHWDSRRISASRTTAPTAHRTWASTARRTWEPARKAISESGARQFFTKSFLGENAAVLAESSSERGHDSAGAATRRINSTLGLASIFGMSKDGALNDGIEGASSFGAENDGIDGISTCEDQGLKATDTISDDKEEIKRDAARAHLRGIKRR